MAENRLGPARWLFVVAGGLSLVVGLIGVFVPLLPTTPFVLLAAVCFNRGSPRFHAWLVGHPWFGPPIADWQQHRAIRTRYKLLATTMVVLSSVFVLGKPTIPMVGKVTYVLFVGGLMTYVWTRRSA